MSNSFYVASLAPATGSQGSSAVMRAEFAAIEGGFDLLPTLSSVPYHVVHVNAGSSALTTTAGFSFDGATLSVPGVIVGTGGMALTGNITLAAYYISYDGTNAGISIDASQNVTLSAGLTVSAAMTQYGGATFGTSASYTDFVISNTASAVNYLQVTGQVTTGQPILQSAGSDASIGIRYIAKGTGGIHYFETGSGGSVRISGPATTTVNYLNLVGAATGTAPYIHATGSDANVDFVHLTKAAGSHIFRTNDGSQTQFLISHTASAVNYITVTGASGGLPYFLAAGSSTDIAIGHYSKGLGAHYFYSHSGGNLQFIIDPVASSVNYARLAPSVTGLAVQLYLEGTDTDINMLYSTKGAGQHQFWTHNRSQIAFQALNAAGSTGYAQIFNSGGTGYWSHIHSSGTLYLGTSGTGGFGFYTDNNGSTLQFAIARTASAVNYLQVSGAVASGNPYFLAAGSDTNIGIHYVAKGTDVHQFYGGSGGETYFVITGAASTVDYHQFTGAATGSNQALLWSAVGSDATIALGIAPKGAAGCVQVGPDTGVSSNPTRVVQIRPGGTGRSQLGLQGYDSAGAGQMAIDFIANDGTALGAIGTVSVTGNPMIYTSPTAHSFNTGAGTYGGGNRQFYVTHTASAVNYVQATGGVTGSPGVAYLSAQGSDSNISLYLQTKGTGAIGFTGGASINIAYFYPGATNANYFQFFASAAGSSPTIQFGGSDTDVSGVFRTQAAGGHYFYTASGAALQFVIAHTASAVNYLQVTGAATGAHPGITAVGTDSNLLLKLTPKGSTGRVYIDGMLEVGTGSSGRGVYTTSYSLGTISSGTTTPNPQDSPLQHYTNNGAHTLAPSSNAGSIIVDITNGASAGAITTTGFTQVSGDSFTTTNAHKFRCSITIGNAGSLLAVTALQ